MTWGTCDFEHDSAYALKLPLVGVTFNTATYHTAKFTAWVDPNDVEGFHVPPPGYNPMEHPKIHHCSGVYDPKKEQYCKWGDGKPHIIVPQGFYVPPVEPKLYQLVRGKKVTVHIGPTPDASDDD